MQQRPISARRHAACGVRSHSPAIIGPDEIVHRRHQTGLQDIWALTYPEQFNIARLLNRPTFLRAVTACDADAAQRHANVASEVQKIIPAHDDADPWRATNRVWTGHVFA